LRDFENANEKANNFRGLGRTKPNSLRARTGPKCGHVALGVTDTQLTSLRRKSLMPVFQKERPQAR